MNVDLKIIGGDFNLVIDLALDKQGGQNSTHIESVKILKEYIEQCDLKDIWRQMNPDVRRYTWRTLRPNPIFVRIDFFLVTDRIQQSVINTEIVPGYKTDHSMPTMTIEIGCTTRGPGYWKFNTSLLDDLEFTR